jgi:hypothetical protein
LALVWRKDNLSPLLAKFVTDVGSLVKRKLERVTLKRPTGS